MDTKPLAALRIGGLALALLFGAAAAGLAPVAAQEDAATEVAEEAESAAQTADDATDDDGGFDDWGLLGLLGLAGLAGLARRPARDVVVDPTPTRRA